MRATQGALLILTLILMVKTICNGCGNSFERLTSHQASCKGTRNLYGGLKHHIAAQDKAQRIRTELERKQADKQRIEAARRQREAIEEQACAQAEEMALQPVFTPTASRSGRRHRAPAKFQDMVPTSLRGLPAHIPRPPPPPVAVPRAVPDEDHMPPPPPPPPLPTYATAPNRFGVYRQYTGGIPQHDPEETLPAHSFADAPSHIRPPVLQGEQNPLRPFGTKLTSLLRDATTFAAQSYAPFLNWTTFKIMEWQYSGSNTKSAAELQRLVDEVILQDEFRKEDLEGFSITREKERLDHSTSSGRPFNEDDGWRESKVDLHLPKEKREHASEETTPTYTVRGIWTRKFTTLIREACEDPITHRYHWFPFSLFRRRTLSDNQETPPERIYSEIYNSDAMKQEHADLHARPRNPEDSADIEYATLPILVYSDSTHLTNFGTASLWPIYVWFGSLTKYLRIKPSAFAAHHLAYIHQQKPSST